MKTIRIYAIILSISFSSISCEPEEINYEESKQIEICSFPQVGDTGGHQETPPPPKKD